MKESPILFSTQMVESIMLDLKTQTRRIMPIQPNENGVSYMKNPPLDWEQIYKEEWKPWKFDTDQGESMAVHCRYGQPGDLLWVKETFCALDLPEGTKYLYKADPDHQSMKWKPSIHMPKAAARIWLKIVSITPEKLQDISEADCYKEGIIYSVCSKTDRKHHLDYVNKGTYLTAKSSFMSLWISINGQASWDANPWVWNLDFEVISKTGKPCVNT